MFRVAVLMSTYNGEKYLREQIDSVLNQEGVEAELFVRDDGSSDGTPEQLSAYAAENKKVHVFFEKNVGVGNSFMNLLYSVPSDFDYYAFADQDDIWCKDKLQKAVETLLQSGKLLYASNQECVDKDGCSIGIRYSDNADIHLSPISILTENMLAGCTMVFPRKFYEILSDKEHRPGEELLKNRIHDVWVAMAAALYDGLIYDKRSFIKYRQHANNVVGAKKPSLKKRIKAKLQKFSDKSLRCGRSKLAREVVKKFPLQAKNFALIGICADAKTCKGKRLLLKNGKILRTFSKESRWSFGCKVIFGLF